METNQYDPFAPQGLSFSDKKDSTPGIPYLRLANRDLKGNCRTEPGKIFVAKKDEMTFVEPFLARVVFAMEGREKKGVGGKAVCTSFNRFTPAPRIAEPFCQETPAARVGKLLEKYEVPKAKVLGLVPLLTNDGVLHKCGVRNPENGRYLPLCRCAVKGDDKTCKENFLLYVLNQETHQMYKVTLSGGSLYGSKESPAPFRAFQEFIWKNRVKFSDISFTMGSVADGMFFRWDFKDISVDPPEDVKLAFWQGAAEQDFKRMCEYIPPELKAKKEAPEVADPEERDDDDINF